MYGPFVHQPPCSFSSACDRKPPDSLTHSEVLVAMPDSLPRMFSTTLSQLKTLSDGPETDRIWLPTVIPLLLRHSKSNHRRETTQRKASPLEPCRRTLLHFSIPPLPQQYSPCSHPLRSHLTNERSAISLSNPETTLSDEELPLHHIASGIGHAAVLPRIMHCKPPLNSTSTR